MSDILIGGSSATIVIVLIIQLAKSYGMDGKYAPLAAALLGILASLLVAMDENGGNTSYWVNVAVRGFVYGLAAVGFQSASASLQKEADKKQLVSTAQEDQTITKATTTSTPEKVTTDVVVKPIGGTSESGTIPPQTLTNRSS